MNNMIEINDQDSIDLIEIWDTEDTFYVLKNLHSWKALKQFGDIITPMRLVQEIESKIPTEAWKSATNVLDPCCGRGSFLIEAKKRLIEDGSVSEIEAISKLYGCDRDIRLAYITAALIDPKGLCDKHNIYVGDSLNGNMEWKNMKFDVISMNPPYSYREGELDPVYSGISHVGNSNLRNKSTWLYFFELATRLVSDTGYVGMVIPNRWRFPDIQGKYLRDISLARVGITDVVVMDSFPGANIKVDIVIAQKGYSDLTLVTDKVGDKHNIKITPNTIPIYNCNQEMVSSLMSGSDKLQVIGVGSSTGFNLVKNSEVPRIVLSVWVGSRDVLILKGESDAKSYSGDGIFVITNIDSSDLEIVEFFKSSVYNKWIESILSKALETGPGKFPSTWLKQLSISGIKNNWRKYL